MAVALDLFCGAGGAAMGLHRSGLFDRIVGVDIEPQPDYPFEFFQGDAMTFSNLYNFDFVWASPPCERYSATMTLNAARGNFHVIKESYPDLVDPTGQMLAGHPWTAIENVPGAGLRPDIVLEGGNVGIAHLKRRRHFEVSWDTLSPKPMHVAPTFIQAYGHGTVSMSMMDNRERAGLPRTTRVSEIQDAFDVKWVDDRRKLNRMVVPAYARYVVEDAVRHGFGA